MALPALESLGFRRYTLLGVNSSVRFTSSLNISLGLKSPARRDPFNEILETVSPARKFLHDAVDFGTVWPFHPPAAGIAQKTLRQGSGKLIFPLEQNLLQTGDVLKGLSVGQFARSIDGRPGDMLD